MAIPAFVQLSERRLGLLADVEAVVAEKRSQGAGNGALIGHIDLINALRDPRRIVNYCPKCKALASGAMCDRLVNGYRCDTGIFSILVGE